MDILSWTPDYLLSNESLCINQLENADLWNKIPSINCHDLHELKQNRLVHFRGMVQDMFNPEFYYEKFKVTHEQKNEQYFKQGKYQDTAELTDHETIVDSSDNITSSRQTLVLISVPGTNTWVHTIEKERRNITPLNQNDVTTTTSDVAKNKSVKRRIDDEEMQVENETESENKKICNSQEPSPSSFVSKEHILNFPLSDEGGKCCHLKLYCESESIKLNEMLDVVGFLSLDPVLTDPCYHNNDVDNQMEIETHNPPPSLVPRIHCVAFRKIQDCNPLIQTISLTTEHLPNIRKDLLTVLTQVLFGDELAAEYLLCHLISNVYLRKELMALGKFSLNLTNIPALKYPKYGEDIYEILKMLVPKSHYLPMTLDNMNALEFVPKKDYECNRLTSGVLQLSNNTHLVLDETKLEPGKLNGGACRGIAAISDAIKTQKVSYDFNYYQMEYECDIPFLIISEGKSLLPSDVHLPMVIDGHCLEVFPEILTAANFYLKPELLNNIRVYLSNVRYSSYDLPNTTMEFIQDEFVKMRQNINMTGEDLHHLLVLSRLICLSSGKTSLDEECWQKACDMETKRKERIAKANEKKDQNKK